jgi:hypothetical protein
MPKTAMLSTPDAQAFILKETDKLKMLTGPGYRYIFRKADGFFVRCGDKEEDDPQWSPVGPEILDIEITDCCRGIRDKKGNRAPCDFCYKSNGPGGKTNMSLDTFKSILAKMGPQLTQIAFGLDAECNANPDTFAIMRHCREQGVVPNVTVADITPEVADQLAAVCGAVAVSYYPERDKNRCYDSVKMLTDRGMDQVNIHCLVSLERYDAVKELLEDRKNDPRLQNMNAIVFLSLKQKGRGKKFHRLGSEGFKTLVETSLASKIPIGFDSCSFHLFEEAIRDSPYYKNLIEAAEPCESGVFSSYIDASGSYFPCSFYEGEGDWKDGIDVTTCDSFLDVWYHPKTKAAREKLLANNRRCPIYNI